MFKKVFLSYSQGSCFVAGCLLFFTFKGNKNKEEEQEGRTTRKEAERTRREHIYKKNKQQTTYTVHVIKTIERQENGRNNKQQERIT